MGPASLREVIVARLNPVGAKAMQKTRSGSLFLSMAGLGLAVACGRAPFPNAGRPPGTNTPVAQATVAASVTPSARSKTWEIALVSSARNGRPGNDTSSQPSVSADGRYVGFWSWADNLVAGDTNGYADMFLRDLVTGQTELVSRAADGGPADGHSGDGYTEFASGGLAVARDGNRIAFGSWASNLVAGDGNQSVDVFVRDRALSSTWLVSVANDDEPGNDFSDFPAISEDGRFVAFVSRASNLVPGDTNEVPDIFVRDLAEGRTERVSVSSQGEEGNNVSGEWYAPSLSADGRYVAFVSWASNLVPHDENERADIFIRDRLEDETHLVSISTEGEPGNGDSVWTTMSGEGRFVAFMSEATNLGEGGANGYSNAFVRDTLTGTTRIIGAVPGPAADAGGSAHPAISADGSIIVFASSSSGFSRQPGPDCPMANCWDIFAYDLGSSRVEPITVAPDGLGANGASIFPAVSADGRVVAFESLADNLVPGDVPGSRDVFVATRGTQAGVQRQRGGLVSGLSASLPQDTLLALVRSGFGLVFLAAGISKLRNVRRFARILRTYDILPASLAPLAGVVLPMVEGFVGGALLLGFASRHAAAAGTSLVILFGLAMAVNLIRGRNGILCGCAGISSAKISWPMVVRNAGLAGLGIGIATLGGGPGVLEGIFIARGGQPYVVEDSLIPAALVPAGLILATLLVLEAVKVASIEVIE